MVWFDDAVPWYLVKRSRHGREQGDRIDADLAPFTEEAGVAACSLPTRRTIAGTVDLARRPVLHNLLHAHLAGAGPLITTRWRGSTPDVFVADTPPGIRAPRGVPAIRHPELQLCDLRGFRPAGIAVVEVIGEGNLPARPQWGGPWSRRLAS